MNTFPLYGKATSTLKKYLKKLKKALIWSTSINMVRLKIDFPLKSIIVSTNRKKLGIKRLIKKDKNLISTLPVCSR